MLASPESSSPKISSKAALASSLNEIAQLMELAGDNAFACRAYEQGAQIVAALPGEPADWLASGILSTTKGIGKGLQARIREFVATGQIADLEKLRAEIPKSLGGMLGIPGLGPKKARELWKEHGIDSADKLETAARSGALNALKGFGEKTAAKILAGIAQRQTYAARHTVGAGLQLAAAIEIHLRAIPAVQQLEVAGSLRRVRETIKDVDFIAASTEPAKVMAAFLELPGIEQIVARGETKTSVLMLGGIPVDLRVVDPGAYAAALLYLTGSKEHNTALRGRARRRGMRLNEYGLYKVDEAAKPAKKAKAKPGTDQPETPAVSDQNEQVPACAVLLPAATEEAIYKHLGLAYIEPELRENLGEIEAAESNTLPRLLELDDMRGVLHCHTTYSDGKLSVAELAEAVRALGYEYLAICDHSQSAAYAGGLKENDLLRQWNEIDEVAARMKGFTILKGIESDILADGSLDYPDRILEQFDLVVASLHSRLTMAREEMTERVCRALAHPATTVWGHPSARQVLKREPSDIDWDKALAAAAEHGVAVEINTNPRRLDLDWRYLRQAKAAGCKYAINPDAHSTKDLTWIPLGVKIARKGWLEKGDVVNTLDTKGFKRWLKSKKK